MLVKKLCSYCENIIENKAEPTAQNNQAIIHASKKGWTEIVKLLLANGAIADGNALIVAIKNGHVETVQVLLNSQMSPEQTTLTNSLIIANTKGYIEIVRLPIDFFNIDNWSSILTIPYDPTNIMSLIKYAYYGFLNWSYKYQNTYVNSFVIKNILMIIWLLL